MTTTVPAILPADTRAIHLSVRRWRDKVNGNTYFSARIYADGVLVATLPFQYGYGSQAEWCALESIAGPAEDRTRGPLSVWCRDRGIELNVEYADALQRDVKRHGRKEG
jgi:hypothetical protein